MITIFSSLAFRKYKVGANTRIPKVSIIIAARNEESNLKKIIPALLLQDYKDFEIIVSLDRCSDGSKDVLDEHASSKLLFLDIPAVPDEWNAKKFALDQGVKKAAGEWLIFTDADCLPNSQNWLKAIMVQVTNNTDIVIGISPYRSNGSFLSQYVSYESFVTAFMYGSRTLMKKPYMAVGRNLAIRRKFFLDVRGYQKIKGIMGGDDDLFIQLHANSQNTKLILGDDSLVFTEPEKSWKNLFYQKKQIFPIVLRSHR
ncbi:MAG: glycosyltransferase [Bacteroidota bacterium]